MGVVLRSAVAFLFIFLLLKLVGKKELSELSPFELILLVVIGDIVQQGITQEDFSLTGAVLAAGTLALLTVGFSYMSFKFDPARRMIEGLPVVILRDGKLLPEALEPRAAPGSRGGPGGSEAGSRRPVLGGAGRPRTRRDHLVPLPFLRKLRGDQAQAVSGRHPCQPALIDADRGVSAALDRGMHPRPMVLIRPSASRP